MTELLKTYPELPPVGSKGAQVTFSYCEWARLRMLAQESPEFDAQDPADQWLLKKLDWHCADTYDGGEP